MTDFAKTFVGKELHALGQALSPIEQATLALLAGTYATVKAAVIEHGPEVLKTVGAAASAAALSALQSTQGSNEDKAKAAERAALAATETAAATAGIQLGAEVIQALKNSAVAEHA